MPKSEKRYKVRMFSDKEALFAELSENFLSLLETNLALQDSIRIVLGGGRTPIDLNRVLVSRAVDYDIPWDKVILFFTDERCVPPDHDESNYKMIRETFVMPLQIPEANVNRIKGELRPADAAHGYEGNLLSHIRDSRQPLFDLALMGLGTDGHTASLFPGSAALTESKRLVVHAGKGPEGYERVTLTFLALNHSRHAWFLICGKEKKSAFEALNSEGVTITRLPAAGIMPEGGSPVCFVSF